MIHHRIVCDRCEKQFYVYSDYGSWSIDGIGECPYCDRLGCIMSRVIVPDSIACEMFLDFDFSTRWYLF